MMNEDQKIEELYKNIEPDLFNLEQLRRKLSKRRFIYYILLLICIAFIGFMFWSWTNINQPTWLYLAVGGGFIVVALIIWYFYITVKKRELESGFQDKVVKNIVSTFLQDAVYESNGMISESEYYQSFIFQRNCDSYTGSRKVSGRHNKTDIQLSYLKTQYKTEKRTKNGSRTEWYTIFEGLFVIFDSNKNFTSRTFVFPDKVEKVFGSLGRWFQRNFDSNGYGENVYMEDKAFEKKFVVYGTDPVEARYLITPDMQQRLKELDKLFKGSVYLSFVNNKIFCAIEDLTTLFKFNRKKPLNNLKTIKSYVNEFACIIGIIDILDLNTRIWGKR